MRDAQCETGAKLYWGHLQRLRIRPKVSVISVILASVALKTKRLAFDQNHVPIGSGTGFFISPDRLVVTNFHVIEGASFIGARGVEYTT